MNEETNKADIWADLAADEPAISLNEARKLPSFRRHGKTPDLCSVYRWTAGGARPVGGGARVRLETFQQSGRRCTTRSAVLRFLRRLSNAPAAPAAKAADIARDHQAAEKRLARAGI